MKIFTTSKVEVLVPEQEFIKMLGLEEGCRIRNVCFKEQDKDRDETRVIQVTFEDETRSEVKP